MPHYDKPFIYRIINGVVIKDEPQCQFEIIQGLTYRCTCGRMLKNYRSHRSHIKSKQHRMDVGELSRDDDVDYRKRESRTK